MRLNIRNGLKFFACEKCLELNNILFLTIRLHKDSYCSYKQISLINTAVGAMFLYFKASAKDDSAQYLWWLRT